mmetsp:Transcript_16242/g.32652  ORF Transcript_16242/g.32652 Transcript_16242/m.32652 type:complete len:269 (-) Transcript_16242:536-1342(-)
MLEELRASPAPLSLPPPPSLLPTPSLPLLPWPPSPPFGPSPTPVSPPSGPWQWKNCQTDNCHTNLIAAGACTVGICALVLLIHLGRSNAPIVTTTSGLMLLGGGIQAAYVLIRTGGDPGSGSEHPYAISRDPVVHDIIYYVLLPPIIYEAGFTMRKRNFFANIGAVMLLAIAGTLIAIVVAGVLLFALARAEIFATHDFTLNQLLLFSSLSTLSELGLSQCSVSLSPCFSQHPCSNPREDSLLHRPDRHPRRPQGAQGAATALRSDLR